MTAQWELKKGWYCKQRPQQTSNNKPPWVGRFEVEVKLSLIRGEENLLPVEYSSFEANK